MLKRRTVWLFVAVALSSVTATAISAAPAVPANTRGATADSTLIWQEDFATFDPAAYDMQRIGGTTEAAYWDSVGQHFVLTAASDNKAGRLFFDKTYQMDAWDAEFDFRIGGGEGGDGMTFAFCEPDYFPSRWGAWLDFSDADGYAVEFDTHHSSGSLVSDPTTSDHIAVLMNSASHHVCYAAVDDLNDNQWHHALIRLRCGVVRVWLDGRPSLNCEIPGYEPFEGRFGFTAATGALNDYHVIDNVHVYRPGVISSTWYVKQDGSGDAATIQAALDSATGCDTVLVAGGTYYEHELAMKNGVYLRSESGCGATIIDVQGLGAGIRCVKAKNLSTRIEGFTIKNATDCAIQCRSASPQIVDNFLTSNTGARGAAINCEGGSPTIEGNVCVLNSAAEAGGAIRCYGSGYPTIRKNEIRQNSARLRGGGLRILATIAAIEDNQITDNSCDSLGGGVDVSSEDAPYQSACAYATLTGNTISRNAALKGAGVSIGGRCTFVTVDGNRIEANDAIQDGGGVWSGVWEWSSLKIGRNQIISNRAGGRGGGVWLGGGASVDSNLVAFNSAAVGGGMCCDTCSSEVGITCNTIYSNTSEGGAGIHLNSSYPRVTGNIIAFSGTGAGILCERGASPVMSCNDIWRNEGGDRICGQNSGGNFSKDPLFCNVADTNFTLASCSRCLDDFNCGRVGAYGQGCSVPPPQFAISVFQNPYVTNHLDIYVILSEGIVDTSLHCRVEGQPVGLEENDPAAHVYRADYDLYHQGRLLIEACGMNRCGSMGCHTRVLSAALISADCGGSATSGDGRCEITIPPHAIRSDAFVLILDPEKPADNSEPVYEVSPFSLDLAEAAEVAISYDDTLSDPEHLTIARIADGKPIPLVSSLDRQNHQVVASTRSFGPFALVRCPGTITPDREQAEIANLQVHPVPFGGTAEISFRANGSTRVRARIVSADGRVVKELLNGVPNQGIQSFRWDGTDEQGHTVGSGVYFCSIDSGSRKLTGKIIYLR
jgi:hypothetical protein